MSEADRSDTSSETATDNHETAEHFAVDPSTIDQDETDDNEVDKSEVENKRDDTTKRDDTSRSVTKWKRLRRSQTRTLQSDALRAPRGVRITLALLIVPLFVGSLAAAAILRPQAVAHPQALGAPTELVEGTATNVTTRECQPGVPSGGMCSDVQIAVETGPDKGQTVNMTITEGPGQPRVKDGAPIIVGRTDDQGQITYYFSDLQRSNGLALVGIAFAIFVVAVARMRGLGALVGLAVTFAIITKFVLPSILDGNSPVLVTLVGASLIIIVVLYIAHGINARTSTAIIGTLTSLAIVGIGSVVAVRMANITGLSNEEVTYIQSFASNVNIEGLLLAGIILGGLGVLNDMTVSQASSVWEIHGARPTASRREVYSSAMRVGRDHIASTIYTLVLAYTGAALPLLILFTLADRSLGSVLTTDIVGEEIVRSAVGGIGLIASVPITTALAALVVKKMTGGSSELTEPANTTPDGGTDSVSGDGFDTESDKDAKGNPDDDHVIDLEGDSLAGETDSQGLSEAPVGDREVQKLDDLLTGPNHLQVKTRRTLGRKKDVTTKERKMSRRERKFWEGD